MKILSVSAPENKENKRRDMNISCISYYIAVQRSFATCTVCGSTTAQTIAIYLILKSFVHCFEIVLQMYDQLIF